MVRLDGQDLEIALDDGRGTTIVAAVADLVTATGLPALMLPGRTLEVTVGGSEATPQLWGWRLADNAGNDNP
ncbi:hypothetical protein [Streptomonospora litoralis]|uniref:hypothetical protein n=1 Tax=Streptomonospora litoralis TaxID=2498135 RepID=UPI0013F16AD8|nr:hypothetical protein [Streptomonospora litoralis]